MLVIGLTGSIGMGKTYAAWCFRQLGVPVYDADKWVHHLLKYDKSVIIPVSKQFPEVMSDNHIDRKKLGAAVFADSKKLQQLETILHPRLAIMREAFLRRAARTREPLVVLDVPLLFETGMQSQCDVVAVVDAPKRVQQSRVLKREGMTEERFQRIMEKQLPQLEKKFRADVIIPTGVGKGHTFRTIRQLVNDLRG